MATQRRSVWLFCLSFITFILLFANTPTSAQPIDSPPIELQPIAGTAAHSGYPPDPPRNIGLSADFTAWSDVVAAFAQARQQENALLGLTLPQLALPEVTAWAAMSSGEKVLWLINAERTARGLAPMQGLETNVNGVAQEYAEWLLAHNAFDHDADGRSPWERLDDNAAIGACHDFLGISENIAFAATTSDAPDLFSVEEAVYRMLYEDAGSGWGHRHAMLWSPYTENSGTSDREGFLGVGHAHGGYTYDGVYYQNTDVLVMNFFDPCATWQGPESSTPIPTETPISMPTATPTPTPTVMESPSPTVSPTPTHAPTGTPTPQAKHPPSQPTRTVSGQVTVARADTMQTDTMQTDTMQTYVGLAGVTVTSEQGQTTVTDADGWFTLAGLLPGPHTLTFSKADYSFTPATLAVDVSAQSVAGVTVDGEPGPAGNNLSFAIHFPLIRTD